jgi:protein SCO1/2
MPDRFVLVLVALSCWSCADQEARRDVNPEIGSEQFQKPACCQESKPAGELPDTSIFQLESEWRSQEGKTIRLAQFHGRPIVLAMMFTSCEYACPRILTDLKFIEKQLPTEYRNTVRFLLVSFDTKRDKPAVLKVYAKRNDLDLRRWTLLHGAENDVRELAAVLGVNYMLSESGGFSHSNLITVLDLEGRVLHRQNGLGTSPQPTLDAIGSIIN